MGTVYMRAIAPFRHLIVYPSMLRQIGRQWRARTGDPTAAHVGQAAALHLRRQRQPRSD